MKAYKAYLKFLTIIENVIIVTGFSTMLLVTFLTIVDRKVKIAAIAFSTYEELTCAFFLLVTLVGAAIAARKGMHLGLSVVTDLLPSNLQKATNVFAGICGITFSCMLIVYGAQMVQSEMAMNMRTAALGWPEWVFGSFVPIGGAFMTLEFINFIIYSNINYSAIFFK